MQAVILAAGMGKRLKELTSNATKCMVEVNNVTMIERALTVLEHCGLSRIVIVVGYEAEKLRSYIGSLSFKTPIEYVENTVYATTNNIYSLYLARHYLVQEDTLLLESDIVFEEAVLRRLLENPYPSLALVAKHESWMDGTVVTLDEQDNITRFISKKEFQFSEKEQYYKTVNIYKFSRAFSKTHYVPFLEAYCKALGNNEYYEQVLKVITLLEKPEIKAERLGKERWYEIDDIQDLDIAETIFARSDEKLKRMQGRYGGYWRYEGLLDFCYLVNPYYPCERLKEELKSRFDTLLCQYPSGMNVNSLLAAKYFGIKKEHICVGNGAAELIKALIEQLQGTIGVIYPTFEEYPNRADIQKIVKFVPANENYAYTAEDIIDFYSNERISSLLLINPDNPSGNYIKKTDVLKLAEWSKQQGIDFILDESFVDFAEELQASMLSEEILQANPHMLVIKSISKSYGVPGLRLGIIAGANEGLIAQMKQNVAIWNINSFAEYYLQIFEKYRNEYEESLVKIKASRKKLFEELKKIEGIRPIPSQANYIMIQLLGDITSSHFTGRLLDEYEILVKDCSGKNAFAGGQYIRVAVRDEEENAKLLNALRQLLEHKL